MGAPAVCRVNTAPKNRAVEDHSPSLDGVGPGARRPGKQHGSFKRGLRNQHAASRVSRPKRSRNFRRRGSGAGKPGAFWLP